jgi:magnesium chelatase family protein
MLAVTESAALIGVEAQAVHVEVNTGETGELRFILVGLPDAAVKESQDRVFSAMANTGFRLPNTRTTINLAPGNLKKEGPAYDLPVALALLAAMRKCEAPNLKEFLVAGELSLSGQTRPIKGAIPMARLAKKRGKRGIILPIESAQEAALVEGVDCYAVKSLDEAVRFINQEINLNPLPPANFGTTQHRCELEKLDFADVKGQAGVKRAVEIAVSGGHNLLMIGSPGSGKSMIAKRIPSIMPPPSIEEYLEILTVHSTAGLKVQNAHTQLQRPFRSPHHTISDVGLLGGGSLPGPGEVSLAHNGVLFLDELPEFKRSALEVLRQPLEDGQVSISRSAGKITLPSNLMLVAAMNPCPCGYQADKNRECRCSAPQIQRYRSKISGPLLDRIDIHIEAPTLQIQELRSTDVGEASATIRARCIAARKRQKERFDKEDASITRNNAQMSHREIREYCSLDTAQGDLLQQAMEQLSLSARAYDRILKVARTIADLAESDRIATEHLLEAIQYRSLDRNLFY